MRAKPIFFIIFSLFVVACFGQQPFNPNITSLYPAIPSDILYQRQWDHAGVAYYSLIDSLIPDIIKLDLVMAPEHVFCYPIKTPNKVISHYGKRRSGFHYGTDIKLTLGDTIYAVFDGKVRLAKSLSGYGKMVGIRHYNGLETVYGHMSAILVKVNQDVKAGQPIGLGGHTGRATCDHLHLEIRLLGVPFDAQRMIDFEKQELTSNVITYEKKKRIFEFNMHLREPVHDSMPTLYPDFDVHVQKNNKKAN